MFPKLRKLNLAYSRGITDAGIEQLARALPQLQSLDLLATSITPRAIEVLSELPDLITIGIQDCESAARGRPETGQVVRPDP